MTTIRIRTLEQLSDSLAADLVWRKKELAVLKSLIESATMSSSQEKTLLRCGITILYAHWEGFIKNSASDYLEFISMRRLKYNELSSNFVALAFKSKLKQAHETNKATIFTEAVDFIRLQLDERSSVPYKDIIQTGSNLSSSIFKEIVCILGLDYSFYETKQILIDEKLLAKRNNIAHGEYLQLDKQEYLELHSQIVGSPQLQITGIMDHFRTQIENCAICESYRC
jgi:MAE_28990/MAE_18760-like HEPN